MTNKKKYKKTSEFISDVQLVSTSYKKKIKINLY